MGKTCVLALTDDNLISKQALLVFAEGEAVQTRLAPKLMTFVAQRESSGDVRVQSVVQNCPRQTWCKTTPTRNIATFKTALIGQSSVVHCDEVKARERRRK